MKKGEGVVSGTKGGYLVLWDANTGQCIRSIRSGVSDVRHMYHLNNQLIRVAPQEYGDRLCAMTFDIPPSRSSYFTVASELDINDPRFLREVTALSEEEESSQLRLPNGDVVDENFAAMRKCRVENSWNNFMVKDRATGKEKQVVRKTDYHTVDVLADGTILLTIIGEGGYYELVPTACSLLARLQRTQDPQDFKCYGAEALAVLFPDFKQDVESDLVVASKGEASKQGAGGGGSKD